LSYSIYPNAIDSSDQLPITTDNVSSVKAEVVNRLRDSVIAVESELGIQPSSTFTTVRARLDALDITIAAIIAGGGGGGGSVIQAQEMVSVINGQTSIPLSQIPQSGSAVEMFVNGLKQTYGIDYSVSGTTVTWANADFTLISTDIVEFWYIVLGSGGGGGGGGGGGSQTLTQTLALGNTTGGKNIIFSVNDNIELAGDGDNHSITYSNAATAGTGVLAIRAQDAGGNGNGGALSLFSGAGSGSGNGGLITLQSGAAGASGIGGEFLIYGGDGVTGGDVLVSSGQGTSVGGGVLIRSWNVSGVGTTSGEVAITTGSLGTDDGVVGLLAIITGDASTTPTSSGGNLVISTGSGSTAGGKGGSIAIVSGGADIGGDIIINANLSSPCSKGGDIFIMSGASTTGQAGKIYLQVNTTSQVNGAIEFETGYATGVAGIPFESHIPYGTTSNYIFPGIQATIIEYSGLTVGGGDGKVEIRQKDGYTSGTEMLIIHGINSTGGASGNGGTLVLVGGTPAATSIGGSISLIGGPGGATSGGGGTIDFEAGSATTDGVGGNISVAAGNAIGANDGGTIYLDAGAGGLTGVGGNIDARGGGSSPARIVIGGYDNTTDVGGSATIYGSDDGYAQNATIIVSGYDFITGKGGDINITAQPGHGPGNGGTVYIRPAGAVDAGANGSIVLWDSNAVTKFEINATGIGFFATSPIAKPTVTGSRGGNAALASLLTQLANLGLITDSSS